MAFQLVLLTFTNHAALPRGQEEMYTKCVCVGDSRLMPWVAHTASGKCASLCVHFSFRPRGEQLEVQLYEVNRPASIDGLASCYL